MPGAALTSNVQRTRQVVTHPFAHARPPCDRTVNTHAPVIKAQHAVSTLGQPPRKGVVIALRHPSRRCHDRNGPGRTVQRIEPVAVQRMPVARTEHKRLHGHRARGLRVGRRVGSVRWRQLGVQVCKVGRAWGDGRVPFRGHVLLGWCVEVFGMLDLHHLSE